MIKYKVTDGLVSAISDDIDGIQNAVYQNIIDRLGIVIKKPGIKGSSIYSFELAWSYVGTDVFEVTCSNIGPVIFGDYIYITDASDALSVQATFAVSETKHIYLKRTLVYTNDQEDNFKPGHPVDENGDPPASGYNIESEYVLELGLGALPDSQVIILGTITRDGDEATISSLLHKRALMLEDFALMRENTQRIQNLNVESIFQDNIIVARALSDTGVNRTPSRVNMTSNKLYLGLSWDFLEDTFAYQTRLQILNAQGYPVLKPSFSIIPQIKGEESIKTCFEVIEGVKYQVAVRSLSSNPNHDPGSWTTQEVYAGAPDLSGNNPIPAPELSVVSIHGAASVSSVPHLVRISATPSESSPEPYFVQIFKMPTPLQGNSIADDAKLIYEGNAPFFLYNIPEKEICYFAARTVCPGGLCSSTICVEDSYEGNTIESPAREIDIQIPIAIEKTYGDSFPFRLFSFYPPTEGYALTKLKFFSAGSVLFASGSGDKWIKVDIAFGRTSPEDFLFINGDVNGTRADTRYKLSLGQTRTYVFPTRTDPTDNMELTAEEYGLLYASNGYMLENAPPWESGEEVNAWMTVYDYSPDPWDTLIVAGTIHLVFERLVE